MNLFSMCIYTHGGNLKSSSGVSSWNKLQTLLISSGGDWLQKDCISSFKVAFSIVNCPAT